MKKYVISAGHGKLVSGAIGFINEHNEAVKLVNAIHTILKENYNSSGYAFEEKTARNQNDNLSNIVKYHNSKDRDIDISIHFNSASNDKATGTEVCYYDAKGLASDFSKSIASAIGINDRGAKERKELYFLRNTEEKALLLEVCFVSNKNDSTKYKRNFNKVCNAIAKEIALYLDYTKKKGNTHIVVKGDTLYSIAKNNNVTLKHLLSLNKLDGNSILKVGQKIKL